MMLSVDQKEYEEIWNIQRAFRSNIKSIFFTMLKCNEICRIEYVSLSHTLLFKLPKQREI